MDLSGKLAFASGKGLDFDIWCLRLGESEVPEQLTFGEDLYEFPAWSPDGKSLACIRTEPQCIASLWLRDGSDQWKKLTNNIFCQHPSWCPDGRRIVFTANAKDPNEIDIFTIDVHTKEITLVAHFEGQEKHPAFSPCGKFLVFAAPVSGAESRRNLEIWRLDLESGKRDMLTDHQARDYTPVYSPCGNFIAFVSHREGFDESYYLNLYSEIRAAASDGDFKRVDAGIKKVLALEPDSDIYIMNSDGTNVRQLTRNAGADQGPCFSPCGKYLAYTASVRGNTQRERLHVIDIASGKEMPLRYSRDALLDEIASHPEDLMNRSFIMRLIPDIIERRLVDAFVDPTFFGEERQPSWGPA